jgi:hypothetical protein
MLFSAFYYLVQKLEGATFQQPDEPLIMQWSVHYNKYLKKVKRFES